MDKNKLPDAIKLFECYICQHCKEFRIDIIYAPTCSCGHFSWTKTHESNSTRANDYKLELFLSEEEPYKSHYSDDEQYDFNITSDNRALLRKGYLAALSSPEVNKEEDREGRRYFEAVSVEKELPTESGYYQTIGANGLKMLSWYTDTLKAWRTDQYGIYVDYVAHWLREVSYKEEELRQENERLREALRDIQNWNDELADDWGDPGERAKEALTPSGQQNKK